MTAFQPGIFDPAPLLRQLTLTLPDLRKRPVFMKNPDVCWDDGRVLIRDDQIAEALGVSRRSVQRWKHGARLRPEDADYFATRLGFHPANIWPDWYELVSA